jgi:hypothetical protein
VPSPARYPDDAACGIRSYCDYDDTVCQSGATGQGHFGYWNKYTNDAAAFVRSKLG